MGTNKIVKTIVKFVPPIVTGVLTVMSEIENKQLKDTVKVLSEKVAKLEKN